MNWDNFDKKVDLAGLTKDVAEAEKNGGTGERREVSKGRYEVRFKSIEMKSTKDGRPMLSADAVILEGEFKKFHLFMNRVLYGTKNDANMISSAVGWLKSLGTDVEIEFKGYNDFANVIMDVAEAVDGKLEYVVEYNPDAFNSISIKDVFEVE